MLGFLIGERTLITGDGAGHVRSWMLVREPGSAREKLRQIYDFPPHSAAVTTFSRSERNKSFVTGDESGAIHLNYGTSGERLLTETLAKEPISLLLLSPKSDGVLALSPGGTLSNFELVNRHPEATFKTIFGKTWYEGYNRPEYVWQSTGGTDDFEPKYSLVPLIFGTLKGTFFAMLFAVPIALLSALYTSQFMNRNLRAWVKPIVELLAAVPSVVIGFIAGLWLAPKIAHYAPGIFLLPVIAPILILSVALLASSPGAKRLLAHRPLLELGLLTLTALAALGISFMLGGVVEREFMGGSFESWLSGTLGITYDQRNSLVIGIAMGFAVIPLIFTLTEDCLSSVPRHLTAGSLALGATRWQTALKIVLPTASPGIFSAMMIGLGRAVGETMIVLMATGNTPVMNWSIFNGFRALSANIAVELPEAPDGGTLYRVLFLAALLLFLMTFAVNTVSELIRLRLRKKYEHL